MNLLFFLTPKASCSYLYDDYTLRQALERMEHSGYTALPILNRYGETEVSIQKRLEKKDRSRQLYYNYYTDREWGDYRNYHLALDSAMLGRDTCVRLILQAAERLNQRVF